MDRKKVLIDMDVLDVISDELKKSFLDKVDLHKQEPKTLEELIGIIDDYWAIIRGGAMEHYVKDARLFKKAKNLKLISCIGMGYDDINIKDATKYGIIVTNTPGVMAEDVAEHAVMLMLAAARDLPRSDRETREGEWNWEKHRGIRLWRKKLGQIGLGRIGKLVAEKCRLAFNMEILICDPYVPDYEVAHYRGKRVSFNEVLKEADVISINTPLTKETENMFGMEEFKKMKRTAIIINTARGRIIREKDLIKALQDKIIYVAGLDVFSEEPIAKNNPLLQLPNVVLTQHCASNTYEGVRAMFEGALKNVIQIIEKGISNNIINKKVLERKS